MNNKEEEEKSPDAMNNKEEEQIKINAETLECILNGGNDEPKSQCINAITDIYRKYPEFRKALNPVLSNYRVTIQSNTHVDNVGNKISQKNNKMRLKIVDDPSI